MEPAVTGAVIDVFKYLDKTDRRIARQRFERVGKRIRARPADLAKQRRKSRPPPGADQPEPAILSRAENQVMPAEALESSGDVPGRDRGNVAADQNHRAGRGRRNGAAHTAAEIAASLRQDVIP